MDSTAIDDMQASGLLPTADKESIDAFLAHEGLGVVLFAGGQGQRSDAHDVAVALREILKDYRGQVRAALVAEEDSAALQPRFRVLVTPSLALVKDGKTLEVIPRVRDWADYARAFQRYLGSPAGTSLETRHGQT